MDKTITTTKQVYNIDNLYFKACKDNDDLKKLYIPRTKQDPI